MGVGGVVLCPVRGVFVSRSCQDILGDEGMNDRGLILSLMVGDRGLLHTPKRLMASNLCRGMMVTCSISQRKASSVGSRPGLPGKAIFLLLCV